MAENITVTKNQKVRFSAYGRINRFFFFAIPLPFVDIASGGLYKKR